MGRPATNLQSLLARTVKKGDCLIWQGGLSRDGRYGSVSYLNQTVRVHRVAYTLANGNLAPEVHVLHRCDTPLCINPEHLFVGNGQINVQDKVDKGRQAVGVECNHPHRVLDDEAVVKIRQLRKQRVPIKVLMEIFGCSKKTIISADKGRTWKHVAFDQEK